MRLTLPMPPSANEYDPTAWPYPIPEEQLVLRITMEGEPVSKARARFGRNGSVYTPNKTRIYERALALLMKTKAGGEADGVSRFGLRAVFYRSNRQRIDCDNLLKAVSDAANRVVWADDSQVLEVLGRVFLAQARPRVEIAIYRVEDTTPQTTCAHCGVVFKTYPSLKGKFCSVDCSNASRRKDVKCAQCGKEFNVPKSQAKGARTFCSRQCSLAHHAAKRSAESGPQTWECKTCGGPVSKKGYEICRGCSMKTRSDPSSNYWKLRNAKGLAKPPAQLALRGVAFHDDKARPRVEVEVVAANEGQPPPDAPAQQRKREARPKPTQLRLNGRWAPSANVRGPKGEGGG